MLEKFGNDLKFEKYFTSWDIGSLKKIWKFGKNLEIREVFGNLEKKIGNSGSIWKFGKKLKNY